MIVVVNYYPSWAYDTNVIMSNLAFNFASGVIIIMGVVSFVLSYNPNWRKMLERVIEYLTDFEPAQGDKVE